MSIIIQVSTVLIYYGFCKNVYITIRAQLPTIVKKCCVEYVTTMDSGYIFMPGDF